MGVKPFQLKKGSREMTYLTLKQSFHGQQTLALGAALATALIVAAIALATVKVTGYASGVERPSLIPLDQPAAWSGFTA